MTALCAAGTYYDGVTACRSEVAIKVAADGIEIVGAGEDPVLWPWDEVERRDAPERTYRFGRLSGSGRASFQIEDAVAAAAILDRLPHAKCRRGVGAIRGKVVLLGIAAAASLILTAVYLVPALAVRMVPLVPSWLEVELGNAIDARVHRAFGGATCNDPQGRAALDLLAVKIGAASALADKPQVAVLRSSIANAFALPGGKIYVLHGLLGRAKGPDELAGVLAHELGHVAHRDGLRVLLQTGGTSFLLGLLFGDVTGSGALILVGNAAIDSAYSRADEKSADRFAARALIKLGRSPQALGNLLMRLTKGHHEGRFAFLRTHPLTRERLAMLTSDGPVTNGPALLTDAQWHALKGICNGSHVTHVTRTLR